VVGEDRGGQQQHACHKQPTRRPFHAESTSVRGSGTVRIRRLNTCRNPKYATESFMFETKRRQARMFGSVRYSKVSEIRFSPAPGGEIRWGSASALKKPRPPGGICSG